MVLKRCVYGVDKNPMAVELAKVALWLHTFTVGAPLSFLDHHLRGGDSLFGEKVRRALDELSKRGAFLIIRPVRKAEAEVGGNGNDRKLHRRRGRGGEGQRGRRIADVEAGTAPLKRFLDFWQAVEMAACPSDRRAWTRCSTTLRRPGRGGCRHRGAATSGEAPETLSLALGDEPRAAGVFGQRRGLGARSGTRSRYCSSGRTRLAAEEHFLHWEVAFPGVWQTGRRQRPTAVSTRSSAIRLGTA